MKEVKIRLLEEGYRPVFNGKYNSIFWVAKYSINYFRFFKDESFWFGHLESIVDQDKDYTKQSATTLKSSDDIDTALELLRLLES